MQHESRELAEARKLLSEFDRDMSEPRAKAHLSDALDFLAAVAEANTPDGEREIGRNLVFAYATRILVKVRALLQEVSRPPLSELDYWYEILDEFSQYGFESSEIDAMRSELRQRLVSRHIAQMTESEKKEILKILTKAE